MRKNQRKLFGALSLVNIGLRYMGDDQTLDKIYLFEKMIWPSKRIFVSFPKFII